jgi:hypothetical protein
VLKSEWTLPTSADDIHLDTLYVHATHGKQATYKPAQSTLKPLFGKTRAMDMWGNGFGMK